MEVPKKIFFYWGNIGSMSWLRYMTLYSFRKYNPDWEMELYVSSIDSNKKYWKCRNPQDFFSYTGSNYFDLVENLNIKIIPYESCVIDAGPSHSSNFLKWDKLASSGGVYCDMDVLFLKSIDAWYESIKNSPGGLARGEGRQTEEPNHPLKFDDYVAIGFMYSSGQNRFFRDVYVGALEYFSPERYQSAGVEALYKMLARSNSTIEGYYLDCLTIIPLNVVYPFIWCTQDELFHKLVTDLPDETIGIHWYGGHSEAQKFNNLVTPESPLLDNPTSTMSYFLSRVLRS